jgi:ubiquinone/menaquinone biosynthesis C-methylase UbiE
VPGKRGRPDRELALRRYERLAPTYDRPGTRGERLRRRAVETLDLAPGETVLDVACGTGVNFPLIEDAIGPSGRLIGIDLSPDMAREARKRIDANGWRNVTLIEAPAEEAELPAPADAVLFSFTHDILRSDRALENVLGSVKPGARVVALGQKFAPWFALPINAKVWWVARRYRTTFDGSRRPWSKLGRFVHDLEVEPLRAGSAYIARGRVRDCAQSAQDELLRGSP